MVIGDLSLIRPLAREDVPIIVATSDLDDPVHRSRLPRGHIALADVVDDPDRACGELRKVGKALTDLHGRRPLLVYGTDDTLGFVHARRSELEPCFALLLNRDSIARALLDKREFSELALRRGLTVPRTLGVGRPPATLDDLRPPLVVKPRSKRAAPHWQKEMFGAGKALVFESMDALLADPGYLAHADELIVQERIVGSTVDLVSYHGFSDETGEPLIAFCGRKLHTYPAVVGESALIEVTEDAQIRGNGERAARQLGLVGPYKIDMIRDRRDDRLYVLEVNARFNLWHQLGAAYGINLPLAAYDHLVLGRQPAPSPHRRPRVRWVDLYRTSLACRDGAKPGEVLWSLLRSPNVYATFAWTDPLPAMSWLGTMIAEKWKRVALRRHR